MDTWEKLKILSGAFAAVVIPIALAYIGNTFSSAIKERELQGRFVEIAVDILRKKPEGGSVALRTWATQIIDVYSGVPLTPAAKTELESRPLPESSETPKIRTQVFGDIPESELHTFIQFQKSGGATDFKTEKQPNGKFKVTTTER